MMATHELLEPRPAEVKTAEVTRWVFSLDGRAAGWFADMVKVAVVSARERTRLQPICLYDGTGTPPLLSWLHRQGVEVLRVSVPFRDELFSEETMKANEGTGYNPEHAAGAFLRAVACDHVTEDTFLYTDCDVMFCGDPAPLLSRPEVLAACAEVRRRNGTVSIATDAFNSGVMVFDRKGYGQHKARTIETFRSFHFYHREQRSFDQTILNLVFQGQWTMLRPELNWRPFQGPNPEARIVHFHGPKPGKAAEVLAATAAGAATTAGDALAEIVLSDRAGYAHYLAEFQGFLSRA